MSYRWGHLIFKQTTKSIKLDLEFKSKAKEDDKDIKDHTKRSLKNVG